jgi:hypothetical protein
MSRTVAVLAVLTCLSLTYMTYLLTRRRVLLFLKQDSYLFLTFKVLQL